MKIKYTPGPWVVVERQPFNPHPNVLNPNFARFWIGTAATEWRGPSEIATVSGNKDDEIPGNASLISAAPELLEALKVMIAGPLGSESLVIAKRAVAKAEGGK